MTPEEFARSRARLFLIERACQIAAVSFSDRANTPQETMVVARKAVDMAVAIINHVATIPDVDLTVVP